MMKYDKARLTIGQNETPVIGKYKAGNTNSPKVYNGQNNWYNVRAYLMCIELPWTSY
jgi:hypothetical protein